MTTTQDWRTLPAGRELDALVAALMGWQRIAAIGAPLWRAPGDAPARFGGPDSHPHYSTNLAAAWQVVEKLAEARVYLMLEQSRWINCGVDGEAVPIGTWIACFQSHRLLGEQFADTAPLAICRAALAATEGA